MCPASAKNLVLAIESPTSADGLRASVVNLQRNLNSTGVLRATSAKGEQNTVSSLSESKGEGMLLYALVLAFIQTGAAKSLIDAIRAMFASSKDRNLKLTLQINDKHIPITADDVTGDDGDKIVKTIEAEIAKP